MGDRQPKSLRRQRQAACARRDVDRPLLAFRGLHEYLPAGRPSDRPGTDRDLVDPAALGVDRHDGAVSSSAASPSTKAAVSFRKCTAATKPPGTIARVRSVRDAVSARVSVMGRSYLASSEPQTPPSP